MQLLHWKFVVAVAWILAACVIGVAAGPLSVGAAVLLVVVGLVPPGVLLLLRRWDGPAQTLSESIREARR